MYASRSCKKGASHISSLINLPERQELGKNLLEHHKGITLWVQQIFTNTFKTDAIHERPEVIWLKGREQARTYVGWYVSTTKNDLPNRDKSFHQV